MTQEGFEKGSLVLYLDWLDSLEMLVPADRGIVFSNLLRHVRKEPLLDMGSKASLLFSMLIRQVSWDVEKWERIKVARAEAGRLGGLASGKSRRKKKQKKANEANEAEYVHEHDSEHDSAHDSVPLSPAAEGEGEQSENSVIRAYRDTIEAEPSAWVLRQLEDYRRMMGDATCLRAIEISGENRAVSWNYVKTVLEGMKTNGTGRKPPRGGKRFITNEPGELSPLEKAAIAKALEGVEETPPWEVTA